MAKWLKRFRENQDGLTLIELIVVVAIIGVLAWLITPRVLSALDSSKTTSAESMANEVLAGLERYAAQNNKYPDAIANWAAVSTSLNINTSNADRIIVPADFSYTRNTTDVHKFCALVKANDKAGTMYKMQETGITSGTALTCP